MSEIEWLLLLSQIPSSPSSVRVMVWRRMKAAGAVSLHNGVWALPCSNKNQQFLNEIAAYLNAHEGNSSIFVAKAFTPDVEAGLLSAFNKNIDMDYTEFIDKCKDFLKEIETDIGQEKFTFAELDENEAELQKLVSWLRKIRARDYFGNEKVPEVAATMDSCRKILQTFARAVYANEGINVQENDIEYRDE
ncbi:Chromate resistance protein ChrB [Methanocella sp. MCL-LM]|uniref:Chromate resistance protein ChrB n=1 Tax=Methanocella sp. MCL-LM TaxID=3412035 RepID=UPI003C767A7B